MQPDLESDDFEVTSATYAIPQQSDLVLLQLKTDGCVNHQTAPIQAFRLAG